MRRPPSEALLAAAFALLVLLSLGAFALTRELRSRDDLVNSVELSPSLLPGDEARVAFRLSEPDGAVDVLILTRGGEPIRTLLSGRPLESGTHELRWDGLDDAGAPAPSGGYRLRVNLGEQEREIEPPGEIVVRGPGR
jgi:hypothetical protein